MADSIVKPVVGIDLGTTFSVVAHVDADGRSAIVPNAEGEITTPSVVFLDPAGAVVGKEAVKASEFEPERVARHPKRSMGLKHFPTPVRGENWPPEVLQAAILRRLKVDAERTLGPLTQAVITVPAYFNEPRRKATQDAGRMAGWEVLDIINEPTAAAIAFGVRAGFVNPDGGAPKPETVLVYDLGGGTFDATVMRIEQDRFTVLATAGDVQLGGIDWDDRIVDLVAAECVRQFRVDPRATPAAREKLRFEAEAAKRSLTARPTRHGGVRLGGRSRARPGGPRAVRRSGGRSGRSDPVDGSAIDQRRRPDLRRPDARLARRRFDSDADDRGDDEGRNRPGTGQVAGP